MADSRRRRHRAPAINTPPPAARPSSRTSAARGVLFAATLILIIGFAAYSNSFDGVFVFDDEPALAQNANLGTLWPLSRAMSAPAGSTLSGRPVAALSFALDHAASAGSLEGYHRTNLAIHLAASLLLFGIVRRTLLTAALRDRFGHASTALAFTVALVFAVHPLQTASVTYIVQRVESLMGFFYLGTVYCAIRALGSSASGQTAWMSASVLMCALGMGTKEVMATAPLAVLLWDRQFAPDRTGGRRVMYVALAATWAILAALVAGGHRASAVGFGFPEWPWWRYLMTQSQVVAHYLRLTILPAPLVLDYGWGPAASLSQVATATMVVGALLLLTIQGLVRRAPASFPAAWCFLILAPTSSVIPIVTEVAAEHRMYLPLAGVVTLIVLGIFAAAQRLRRDSARRRSAMALVGITTAAAVVIVLARMTYARNADYQDFARIWSDTIAKRPHNARARNNYATWLLTSGRFADAEPHLRIAVAENPAFPEAEANLGVALSAQGRLDEGAEHLHRAIALRGDYAPAYRNLGETYTRQRRYADAAVQFARALEFHPDDVGLLNRAAWTLATAPDAGVRDGARARMFAQRAVALTGGRDADSLDSLAAALARLGQFDAAAAAARDGLAVARATGNAGLAGGLEARLDLYTRRQAFVER